METRPLIHVVAIECAPENEERLNKWYNEVHIPLLLKFKGLKEAYRYRIRNQSADLPKYVAVYKFASQSDFEAYQKSPELAAAIKEMNESWKPGDIKRRLAIQYEQIKSWK
jgi:uncharacterized protein (TIGR02118 family)